MPIAFIMTPGRGDTDRLLQAVAETLLDQGVRPCGVVQINSDCADGGACDMDVQVLPDGPVLRISQSLGPGARGCRLNPDALEQAVGQVEARLQAGADVLLINKFGKHEASGRGFRSAIAEALALDIPVLVGLNALNAAAFEDFTAGLAEQIPAQEAAVLAWLATAKEDAAVA